MKKTNPNTVKKINEIKHPSYTLKHKEPQTFAKDEYSLPDKMKTTLHEDILTYIPCDNELPFLIRLGLHIDGVGGGSFRGRVTLGFCG